MATLHAATAASSARVTDPAAVDQLCNHHHFGELTWELTDDGEIHIWGYDTFEIYGRRDCGAPNHERGPVTRAFLHSLADYIAAGAELDIQTAGFTKCRFPVLARRYVVRRGEVLHADLDALEPISDTQPAP